MTETGWTQVRIDTDPDPDGWCFCTPASHPDDVKRGLKEEWDAQSQFFAKVQTGTDGGTPCRDRTSTP